MEVLEKAKCQHAVGSCMEMADWSSDMLEWLEDGEVTCVSVHARTLHDTEHARIFSFI